MNKNNISNSSRKTASSKTILDH